jgi:DNA polymerase delta subunit 2
MLEDESGRIRLVGEHLEHQTLVTGVIMAALGMETSNGDFNVVDCCFAGLPPHQHQPQEDLMDTQGIPT